MTNYTTNAAYPYPSATDQLVDYPTTAGSLAGYLDYLPNRNVIINGAMDIWQRGGGGFIATDGMYTADQWRYAQTGAGGTHTVTRVDQPTGSTLIAGMNPRYYLRLSNTVVGSATAQIIGQRIEDVRTLAGQECTLSAWIKGTATGITAKAVQNFGTGGSPSSAVTTTLGTATPTTSWVRLHVHFTMPSLSGKTIGTNENSFVEIQFDCGASLGTLDIWGVQLEQNTTQTAFERRPIQQELALCHRYYYREQPGVSNRFSSAKAASAGVAESQFYLPVPMRIAPTNLYQSGTAAHYGVSNAPSGIIALTSVPALAIASNRVVLISAICGAGLVAGNASELISQNGAAYLGFSAEL
tara:strand:+ start:6664 stop:7728 length:1065 start_codon:yes stop_codon:yes gene_type:complete